MTGFLRYCRVASGTALLLLASRSPRALAEERLTYGSLKFDTSLYDFGEAYRGAQLAHQFRFVNAGPGPLSIQGVHAACGCTAVEVDKGHKYQPGEAGYVEVKLDTTDFQGPLIKTITVMSNETLVPDRTLTMKAQIRSEIDVDPPLVDFGDVRALAGETRSVHIKPAAGTKVDVEGLVFNKDVLDASLAPAKNGWTLTVKLHPQAPTGFLKEQIIVKNSSAHLASLPIPVRGNVLGNIDFSPNYLEFGAIGPGEKVRRTVTMHALQDFDLTGTRVELIIGGKAMADAATVIKVDTLPRDQGKRQVNIELKHPVATTAGSVHGKLYFQTNDPTQKELVVDFYAFFR